MANLKLRDARKSQGAFSSMASWRPSIRAANGVTLPIETLLTRNFRPIEMN